MALSERLAIIIDANGAGAVREFNKVGKTAERELGKTEDSTRRLGASLTQVGAVMVGVGAVLVGGAFKAAQAFEQDQMAVLRLQNTLDRMPLLAGATTDAFIEQANALQAVTKYGDDATISAQAMLGTFNMTEDQVLALTPLVQDYASKFGVDLVEASKQVGKAMMGQIAVLQRNGVTIDANLFKTDRFAAVTQALREQAGGFAEIEGKTMAGQLSILRNNFGDVVEVIGSGAVGAFNSMLGPVKSLGLFMKDLPPVVGETVGGIAAFGGVALIAGGFASLLIGQVILMKERFLLALDASRKLVAFMRAQMTVEFGKAALKGGLIVAAAAAASVALGELFQQITGSNVTDLASQSERLSAALDELSRSGRMTGVLADVDALAERYEQLRVFASLMNQEMSEAGRPGWFEDFTGINFDFQPMARDARDARDEFIALDQALVATAEGDGLPEANKQFNLLRERLIAAGIPADAIGALLPEISSKLNDAGEASGEASIEVQELTEALKQQKDALEALFNPVFGAIDAQNSLRDAQRKAAEATAEVTTKQREYDEAVANFGPTSDEATAAFFALIAAQEAEVDASVSVAEAAVRLESSFINLASEMAKNGDTTAQFEAKLRDWVAQGWLTEEQAAKVKDEFYRVRDAAGEVDGTTVEVNVNSNAGQVATDVERMLDAILQLPSGPFRDNLYGIVDLFNTKPRAFGGPVTAKMPYLVGERGPELFVPDGSGRIVPDDRTRDLLSGGRSQRQGRAIGEKKTVNVYVNKTNADPYEIGRELLWTMKVAG